MVLFVLTRAGFDDMRDFIHNGKALVWLNHGILSATELSSLRSSRRDISTFSNAIDPHDNQAIEGALEMIARHHPDERVWVERYCEPEG